MSEAAYTPRNSPSSEFRAYVQSNAATIASIVGALVVVVGLIVYIARLPTVAEVKTHCSDAIKAHEGKSSHHGVSGMIMRYSPSRVEYAELRIRVVQLEKLSESRHRDLKAGLKDIRLRLQSILERLPRRRTKGR